MQKVFDALRRSRTFRRASYADGFQLAEVLGPALLQRADEMALCHGEDPGLQVQVTLAEMRRTTVVSLRHNTGNIYWNASPRYGSKMDQNRAFDQFRTPLSS